MSVIVLLLAVSLLLGLIFLLLFILAVRGGQYRDAVTPAMRVIAEADQNLEAIDPKGVTNGEAEQHERD